MDVDIKKIISQMTLEEKASLCSGSDFWHTKRIERLGIPSIMMTDGPHGLRKQSEESDLLELNISVPATCFPPAVTVACSWDRKLMEKIGIALGEECQAEDVSILLGPGINIKRSPLCGRNFEYFSEDPYLASEMAISHIKGVQSQGIGTSLKHYAANNQEQYRLIIDVIVDERTLPEIYLAGFEETVKKAQPWTVMCAYNKVNGTFCSENKYLLTDILKEEWGHKGFIVSDWGAVNERASGLAAGLELEMPGSNGVGEKKITEAIKKGELQEETLDKAVERILRIVFKAAYNKKKSFSYSKNEHHALAREAARESMVLLKNDDNILPLKTKGTVAIIGAFAKNPRYQGGGSSRINPTMLENAFAEIKKNAGENMNILYADGYKTDEPLADLFNVKEFVSNSDQPDEKLINEAKSIAAKADVAIVFAGLPENYESEGFDRRHIRIPEGHRQLIEEVSGVQKNTVVVLSNGAPIEMPWLDKVKGVLETYLGGQASGGAVADILFGIANPCGKLAESFPLKTTDNPSSLNFPGDIEKVEYKEGIFVGYRYYDAKEMETLFPFGYGLSYTVFEYSSISLDKKEIFDNETVTVTVKVKNIGKIKGKEIVQLYVRDVDSSVTRPYKELKAFEKIELEPKEEKTIKFVLQKRAFAYYNTAIKDWHVETGQFEILVGKSSSEIVLKERLYVKSTRVLKKEITRNSPVGELLMRNEHVDIIKPMLLGMLKAFGRDEESISSINSMIKGMPLRALITFNTEKFSENDLKEVIKKLNKIS